MMLSAKASTFCKSRVCRRFTGTQTSWIARVCFQLRIPGMVIGGSTRS
jgi:hypothetical protein